MNDVSSESKNLKNILEKNYNQPEKNELVFNEIKEYVIDVLKKEIFNTVINNFSNFINNSIDDAINKTIEKINIISDIEKIETVLEHTINEEAQVITIEKRKRGRPRKEKPVDFIIKEKKQRGRPRKVVIDILPIEEKIIFEIVVIETEPIILTEKRKRGRPRKEKPVNINKEKKQRGRPRKVVIETNIVDITPTINVENVVIETEPIILTEKRKRGRPKKNISEVVINKEKKQRGRPRKVVIELNNELNKVEIIPIIEITTDEEFKNIIEQPIIIENNINEEVQVITIEKRKRGRPKKNNIVTKAIVLTEKRKRGRPRKEEIIQKETIIKHSENNFENLFKIKTGLNFDDFYKTYKPKLIWNLIKWTKDLESAKDVVEDAFIQALEKIETYDSKQSKVNTWIYTIAINLVKKDHDEKMKYNAISLDEEQKNNVKVHTFVPYYDNTHDNEKNKENIVKADIIKNEIENLSDKFIKYKRVLILREIENLSYKEIADELNLKENTIKSQIKKGRELIVSKVKSRINHIDVCGIN